jgi:ribosomal protein L29
MSENNLAQNAFALLDSTTQEKIWNIQTQQLENSLTEVRKQIAQIKETSQTQRLANNPCIEFEDKLKELQKQEEDVWVEIQTRKLLKDW